MKKKYVNGWSVTSGRVTYFADVFDSGIYRFLMFIGCELETLLCDERAKMFFEHVRPVWIVSDISFNELNTSDV